MLFPMRCLNCLCSQANAPRSTQALQAIRFEIQHPKTGIAALTFVVLLLIGGLGRVAADLPIARITSIYPVGGKIGTSFEVSVAGSDLDEASQLYFSQTGIAAKPAKEANKFSVTIASNTPPGIYEAHFLGRFGLSNPRPFVVGTLPESISPSTNVSMATAAPINLEATQQGRAQANAVAWFKFTAKKAQRLFVECQTESIDSRMDPVLAVLDSAGRELERARTSGLIDFVAPAEGTYALKVHDVLYRGGEAYFYRLTLSTAPRVDFVFPPTGLPGTKTNYTIYGRNLPGGKVIKGQSVDGKPLEQLTVEITFPTDERARRLNTGLFIRPGDAMLDGFDYRLKTGKGTSNPFLLTFATAPVVLEQEPNNQPAQAQKLTLPCEVSGRFQPAGENDWFTFQASKGEVYWIEAFSQRLGLPTDLTIVVQRVTRNDKGEEQLAEVLELSDNDLNVGDREFNTASRDPIGRWEVKEDGAYRLLVRDLFQRAEATIPSLYRLSLRRETPDFRLVALTLAPKAKPDAKNLDIGVPFLRRGQTLPVKVMAFRRDGFKGEIELSLEQPPKGLTLQGSRIESGKNSASIFLTCAEDAPAFAGPVKLLGKAKIGDRELVRQVRGATMVFPVGNVDSERPKSRLAREFTLAITDQETAPVSIVPAEQKTWEAPANTKLQVPLKITRRGEFNANLKLKPLGPGPQEALKEFEVDGKATNAILTLDFAALKLAPGAYVFTTQTDTTGKYRNNPDAAALAQAASEEANKIAAELAAAATKAAAELETADKHLKESESAAKTAAEKLAAAKTAAEQAPTDEKLSAERNAAEKGAAEAAAKAKAAAETRAAAEKARTDADARAKEGAAKKEATAGRAKETAERAKPRDVTIAVQSTPIFVKVTPAPTEPAKSK